MKSKRKTTASHRPDPMKTIGDCLRVFDALEMQFRREAVMFRESNMPPLNAADRSKWADDIRRLCAKTRADHGLPDEISEIARALGIGVPARGKKGHSA